MNGAWTSAGEKSRLAPGADAPTGNQSSFAAPLRVIFGAILFCGGIGCLVAAIPALFFGAEPLEVAQILSGYRTDFQKLDMNCTVTFVKECWQTTTDEQPPNARASTRDPAPGSERCWKSFVVAFKPPDATPPVEAWPEYQLAATRNCSELDGNRNLTSGCSAVDARATPSNKFETGGSYRCWKPTGTNVDRRYRCGNGYCWKLNDPAEIVERSRSSSKFFFTFGGCLGVGGLLLACLSFLCCNASAGLAKGDMPVANVVVRVPPPEMIITKARRWSSTQPPPEVDGTAGGGLAESERV